MGRPFLMTTLRTVALAALATTFFLPAQDGSKPSAGGAVDAATRTTQAPLVGVVDFVKAIQQYPKYIRLKGELDKRADAAKAQIEDIGKRIDEQKAALAQMVEGSEDWKDRQTEINLLRQQGDVMWKRLQEKLELEDMRLLTSVYQDLEVAIRKVAVARGVSIVLRTHELGEVAGEVAKMPPKTLQGRLAMFERRQVWYASDQVDLTSDLIKLLLVPLDEPKDAGKATSEKPAATPKTGG